MRKSIIHFGWLCFPIIGVALLCFVGPANSSPVPIRVELLYDAAPLPAHQIAHPRIIWMNVSAYCPCEKCCGKHSPGITASGKPVSYNGGQFVAADTKRLPFFSKLIVPGYANQLVEVIDRGGAIKGNRLDVFFPTHQEALNWGRRRVPVAIIAMSPARAP